ncbi:MAG: DUF4962 domain-containing protein, partial [Verrucomicrobia bacterium]|nr:DUF4962 domain-containing protein [Verrucomicrobiota bacterium]
MNTKMILCAGICAIGLSGLAESAPHTKSRDTFYPNENSVVRANPCPFLWPAERQGDYQFKLGRTPDLSGDEVYRETMQWAFAYPGKKLAPGTWYWQVNNQPVQMFQALENPEYSQEIPSFEAIAARMPKSHPRLLLLAGEREAFAARISPELRNEVLDAADLFLKTSLEEIKPPQVDFSRIDDDTVKRLAINDTKKFLGQVQTPIVYLAKAWLLTGDELYGKKCVELTLGVRNLDARLVGLNDFTRSAVQDTLVFAFDSCYDFFDPADRAAIQKTIADGAEKEYAHHVNRLETQLFDNHTWQKTYASLLRSTIALYGHDERADAWLHYTYKLWFARAPASGFNYDGGWHNGTGYLTANFVTLIQVPLLWKRLAGVDAFEHPWYQNAAKSVLATYPPGSYSAGFGDGHSSQTHPHWKRGVFMQMLAREMNDPYAAWYFQTLEKWEHGKKKRVYDAAAKHKLDSEGLEWFVALSDKPMPAAQPPIDLPLARAMPDTGVVSIHTQPAALKDDIHVAFRSSPFGSGSHCLASQNAFNIIAGGKPLFLSSGYYTSFSDPHTLLQYRHSRGHNTILADGIGQSIGNEGYGQIRRFQTLEKISYAMGDASHAYGGELTDSMWIKNFAKSKVAHSRENGFGDAGVTKYQRHILFIHPINTLVVYDDLEGDHPVEWSWLLHSPGEIKQTGQNQFKASNGLFTGHVDVKGSVKTESALTTKFFSPAVNWQKHTAYDGSVRELPDQWHLSVNSAPTVKTRYLAIIQITPADCAPAAVEWNGGVATIGNWI